MKKKISVKKQAINNKANESIFTIIEATVSCISRLGYNGASMMEIAKKAGVSKSLLHYHFKSKEDLVISAITSLSTRVASEISEHIDTGQEFQIRMEQAFSYLYKFLIADRQHVDFLMEMYATSIHNSRLKKKLVLYQKVQYELILGICQDVFKGTEIPKYISAENIASLIQTAIQGLSIDSIFIQEEEDLKKRYNEFIALLLSSLSQINRKS